MERYDTDEFKMYTFKIDPCQNRYAHNRFKCPFLHFDDRVQRRDPTVFQYSCKPCWYYLKGTRRHGDQCKFAHVVFERWLHPAKYRTMICKYGAYCDRRVCIFAHSSDQLLAHWQCAGLRASCFMG